jgi:hypothetical protein
MSASKSVYRIKIFWQGEIRKIASVFFDFSTSFGVPGLNNFKTVRARNVAISITFRKRNRFSDFHHVQLCFYTAIFQFAIERFRRAG